MKYLLDKSELDNLVPYKLLSDSKNALEIARKMIAPELCWKMYCTDCPIGALEDEHMRDLICIKYKTWPK